MIVKAVVSHRRARSVGLLLILAILVLALAGQWLMSASAVGQAPPVAGDDFAVVVADSIDNAIDVLANDTDPDGDALTVTAVTQGADGVVAIGPDGANVIYTPNDDFVGDDSFTYTVSDGLLTATATVSIVVEEDLVTPLGSLKTVSVPEPEDLDLFVRDRPAAVRLGKSLFWDMQVGSDGIQACASCHFAAGADARAKNQLSPGLLGGSTVFDTGGLNSILEPSDFPFHKLEDPDNQGSDVLSDSDDVASSQGVTLSRFQDIVPGSAVDEAAVEADPVFQVGGTNVRRVEARNTPTVINAVFNRDNFWDGRANHDFNGVNPFGSRDPNAQILEVQANGAVQPVTVSLDNASLASQAVGPPVSKFEMSADGRTFPKLGKKMLSLRPLGKQRVHADDSVLGAMAHPAGPGLLTAYAALIRAAFQPEYWDSDRIVTFGANGDPTITRRPNRPLTTDEFTVMESNFSLFFGLAVQLYESTLVSGDSPFDRFEEGDTSALSQQQKDGLEVFMNDNGRCIQCHQGPEFTNASVGHIVGQEILERMIMGNDEQAVYDNGFYNIGVRPAGEDLGRGGLDPFGNPLSETRLAQNGKFVDPNLQPPIDPNERAAVDGSFKVPGLRNVELTGPYFHNGGAATLSQVMDFYARNGNFAEESIDNLDPEIGQIRLNESEKEDLVAFMKALTDDRVRFERAPFDHPQLFVPNGHLGDDAVVMVNMATAKALDQMLEIPAVGAGGRAQTLQPFDELLARGQPSVQGDANSNGVVTIADALLVAQCVAGFVGPCPDEADANDDGQVTIADAMHIAQFVAGIVPNL